MDRKSHALLDFTLPRDHALGLRPAVRPARRRGPISTTANGTHVNVCNDGDYDTIPDFAEAYMVGTRVPEESTDRDKFDDGQELFGVTYCPGGADNCGYGAYSRASNTVQLTSSADEMPRLGAAARRQPAGCGLPGAGGERRGGHVEGRTRDDDHDATRADDTSDQDLRNEAREGPAYQRGRYRNLERTGRRYRRHRKTDGAGGKCCWRCGSASPSSPLR